jgi:hypothetical protein
MLSADPRRQFERLLLRTGEMNYIWTNTESLLIHLIAGLAGVVALNRDLWGLIRARSYPA